MNLSNKESRIISECKVVLIIMVIFIHTNLAPDSSRDIASYTWCYTYLYNLLGISNPLFFLISGFLYFSCDRFDLTTYKRKTKRRIRSLLIPYFIWNTIYLLLFTIGGYIFPSLKGSVDISITNMDIRNIYEPYICCYGSGLDSYPIDSPLWFIRNLFLISLFTPVIHKICRLKRWSVLIIMALHFLLSPLGNMVQWTVVFFCLGAYMAIHRISFINVSRRFMAPSIMMFVTSTLLIVNIETIQVIQDALSLIIFTSGAMMITAIVSLTQFETGSKILSTISHSLFMIFAMHGLVARIFTKVTARIVDNYNLPTILLFSIQTINVILILLICTVVYIALQNYIPTANKLLGSRKRS